MTDYIQNRVFYVGNTLGSSTKSEQ